MRQTVILLAFILLAGAAGFAQDGTPWHFELRGPTSVPPGRRYGLEFPLTVRVRVTNQSA